eukprot:m.774204 g.774204  ORF g.774204 m.774204 type:complete len:295 (-) comp59102_c0_seq5:913-1797(-)
MQMDVVRTHEWIGAGRTDAERLAASANMATLLEGIVRESEGGAALAVRYADARTLQQVLNTLTALIQDPRTSALALSAASILTNAMIANDDIRAMVALDADFSEQLGKAAMLAVTTQNHPLAAQYFGLLQTLTRGLQFLSEWPMRLLSSFFRLATFHSHPRFHSADISMNLKHLRRSCALVTWRAEQADGNFDRHYLVNRDRYHRHSRSRPWSHGESLPILPSRRGNRPSIKLIQAVVQEVDRESGQPGRPYHSLLPLLVDKPANDARPGSQGVFGRKYRPDVRSSVPLHHRDA